MTMTINNILNLNELWQYVIDIEKEHSRNDLHPILGNGNCLRPKYMFVFINPTIRNISSNKKWAGPRFPFIGTKQIWRIFTKSNLFDSKLMLEIEKNKDWSLELTNKVLDFLNSKKIYITNIVKSTGNDATLPNSELIKRYLPILEKEIEIIRPEYIITFGLIPFEALTKKKIKLSDYYNKVITNNKPLYYNITINTTHTKIIPCYFPIGRGNPKQAIEILKLLK